MSASMSYFAKAKGCALLSQPLGFLPRTTFRLVTSKRPGWNEVGNTKVVREIAEMRQRMTVVVKAERDESL